MEKRDAVLYIRVRPSTKKALLSQMAKDGWDNFSDWFEQVSTKLVVKKRKRK